MENTHKHIILIVIIIASIIASAYFYERNKREAVPGPAGTTLSAEEQELKALWAASTTVQTSKKLDMAAELKALSKKNKKPTLADEKKMQAELDALRK